MEGLRDTSLHVGPHEILIGNAEACFASISSCRMLASQGEPSTECVFCLAGHLGIGTTASWLAFAIMTMWGFLGTSAQNFTTEPATTQPLLYLEDVLPCDQARCAYEVTINHTVAGPEAQQELEDLAGQDWVEVIAADTYSGGRILYL